MEEEFRAVLSEKGGSTTSNCVDYYEPLGICCKNKHFFEISMDEMLNGGWCPFCREESELDKFYRILKELNIPYTIQQVFPFASKLYYDAAFKILDKIVVVEYDDIYHFERSQYESKMEWKFKKRQHVDNVKTKLALDNNFKVIRVDHETLKNENELRSFLTSAINSTESLSISKSDLYSWLNLNDHVKDLENLEDFDEGYSSKNREPILQAMRIQEENIVRITIPPPKLILQEEVVLPSHTGGVVGYCRVSTLMQAKEGISLETQAQKIREYAQYKNLVVKKIYMDEGISGKDYKVRPGLVALLDELGDRTYVVVVSLSRLARNVKQTIDLNEIIERNNSFLVALDVDVNTNTASGRLIFTILSGFYQFEREQTAERVSANLSRLSREKKLKSKPPYGWRYIGRNIPWERNEAEQENIAFIRKLLQDDTTIPIAEIIKKLNLEKRIYKRNKTGVTKKWFHATVKKIMEQNDMLKIGKPSLTII